MTKSQLIVLTCTINPQIETLVKRSSPKERLRDYKISIDKWASLSYEVSMDLLVVENSGYLPELKRQFSSTNQKNIMFHSAAIPNVSVDEGISKGEFLMLRESLVDKLDIYQFIWKCSGRNFPINSNRLFRTKEADLIVERFTTPYLSSDSRFFGMSSDLWREFVREQPNFSRSNSKNTVENFNSMEHLLTRFTIDQGFRNKSVTGFLEIPIFIEKSGSLNKQIMSTKRIIALKILNRFRQLLAKISLGYLL